ncbi:hypothetical protein CYMTET_50918 [Cymbomonas tetramitiformis]|uniref:Uncharacterized protein n=1 Tax=Cymbomonas tetramitiformis TaxID=36881 RepID=A0AAE0BNE6_9CHLO|nr:hypothetical protein CYMTET_50918 [Cymbomonas tetramitiformis]
MSCMKSNPRTFRKGTPVIQTRKRVSTSTNIPRTRRSQQLSGARSKHIVRVSNISVLSRPEGGKDKNENQHKELKTPEESFETHHKVISSEVTTETTQHTMVTKVGSDESNSSWHGIEAALEETQTIAEESAANIVASLGRAMAEARRMQEELRLEKQLFEKEKVAVMLKIYAAGGAVHMRWAAAVHKDIRWAGDAVRTHKHESLLPVRMLGRVHRCCYAGPAVWSIHMLANGALQSILHA